MRIVACSFFGRTPITENANGRDHNPHGFTMFLAGYPYGCVEQTMSRFYPTVLAADTLKKMGTDLETIAAKVRERNRIRHNRVQASPVVDSAELKRMSDAGLLRLYRFQHEDGGWGWWQHDHSSPYMTAYVLLGLDTAANAGVDVRDYVYGYGVRYLIESLQSSAETQDRTGNRHQRALAAYVLSLDRSWSERDHHTKIREVIDSVYRDRSGLNNYGRAMLALALQNRKEGEKATEVLRSTRRDAIRCSMR